MDGPDLSHLLDGPDSAKPASEVLDGIVRRHKRLKVRRARMAASLGLVIAVAGLGVGIGLSNRGRRCSQVITARPAEASPRLLPDWAG
jgi:hypothetical protein